MRRLLVVATLALGAGCFNPDKPTCSYVCSDTGPKCPEDYECRSDNYCHLVGTVGECGYSDAAVPVDMSATVPADLSSPAGDMVSTSSTD
jgi:hypothetical protein